MAFVSPSASSPSPLGPGLLTEADITDATPSRYDMPPDVVITSFPNRPDVYILPAQHVSKEESKTDDIPEVDITDQSSEYFDQLCQRIFTRGLASGPASDVGFLMTFPYDELLFSDDEDLQILSDDDIPNWEWFIGENSNEGEDVLSDDDLQVLSNDEIPDWEWVVGIVDDGDM